MSELIDQLLARMLLLPELLIYAVVGGFAALENVAPPVPADVVALFGGFLAGQGAARAWVVFLVVWGSNVSGAMFVYWIGRRYGARFFATRWGRMLLRPRQLGELERFHRRYGVAAIFVSRFLPVFRAVVPGFAGMSRVGAFRALLPIASASAIWYGLIVYLGASTGRNWEQIREAIEAGGRWIYIPVVVLLLLAARWWWRNRGEPEEAGT